MASLRDEIDNCGLFLEQRRRHAPNWIAKTLLAAAPQMP
jgi:hypothetical protein